jgi:hypothetical protein
MANLEMERIVKELRLLKHRVLERIEQQLQYLLESSTHVLFLMMGLLVAGEKMSMADLEMEQRLIETYLLKLQVLELE